VVADASPAELTRMTDLPTLEEVFAQLVRQVDTTDVAKELVAAMGVRHG
jgi:ABC-2 type transport system ATP-binding protein